MIRKIPGPWVAAMALAGSLMVGCVEEIVYRDRPLYEDPPAAAAAFLGYSVPDTKTTTCGNCHVGQQAEWIKTKHASAWAGLQRAGSQAQPSCENCHTVNELGNAHEGSAGWAAIKDTRYRDVQCESCHGPGLGHVQNPDASQPLASILAAKDASAGCGECHSGVHNPFVEEWQASRHGTMTASPQTNASCVACHEARGVFAGWGIKADYLEKGRSQPIPITCAVCHDPHDPLNPKQLRYPINTANVETNLCMKCHHKRAVPELESPSRGPHSPQGPLLLGVDVGWQPPNFAYANTRIMGTHGSEKNPRLCAGCHVNRLQVTDPATGNVTFDATGHSFAAIPCLDAQGRPQSSKVTCAVEQRSFKSCTTSGCHGTETAARSAYLVAQARIRNLTTELNALLSRVPAAQFSTTDGVYTSAEGAKFNAGLGEIPSSAIHNPFLTEALLAASIQQVRKEYGVSAVSPISLEPTFQLPPRVR
jgi:predicted CXXCH cytochrome family protein